MINCSNCGSNNNDEALYCSRCGAKLAIQSHKQDKEESKIAVADTDEKSNEIEEPGEKEKINQEKPWYKKYLIAIIALCSIVFIWAIAGNFNGPADYTMSAQQFAEEYNRNIGAANAKFNKKIVKLNGIVNGKGQFSNSEDLYITLYYDDVVEVVADFDFANKDAVNKAKGFITVQGEVAGIIPQSNSRVKCIQIMNSKIIN